MKTADRRFRGTLLRRTGITALVAMVAGGCDTLTGSGPPEGARLHIESVDADEAVLVTSLAFGVQGGTVALIEADTQRVALPFDGRFTLTEARRFYVSATPLNTDGASMRMAVWIDETSWFDEARILDDDAPAMEFVYRYRQASLR